MTSPYKKNLREFKEMLQKVATDKLAEDHVRQRLKFFAEKCPMPVLLRLGKCAADCRQEELERELKNLERN